MPGRWQAPVRELTDISYQWRGTFDNAELNSPHAVAAQARAAGSAWLHVDFEAELRDFYLDFYLDACSASTRAASPRPAPA